MRATSLEKLGDRKLAEQFCAAFAAEGAERFEASILQPADVLLDLYGEDIRARAFITHDPVEGEMMLRPDFTVPVVLTHMQGDGAPASYTYSGEVFRKQDDHPDRPSEFFQVGFERFGGDDPAKADAEVFALFSKQLAPYDLRAATGDIGILVAAVRGLRTTQRRRAALLRHIWRPRRFRALMNRFSQAGTALRQQNLERVRGNLALPAAPFIGFRTQSEIDARIAALEEDAAEPAISTGEIELLDDILSLRETVPNVLSALRDIAVDMPSIAEAVTRLNARADALDHAGIDIDTLDFETAFGRTSMEYYDGFVFGFFADTRPDLPPVATGGRYDALTTVLGQGRGVPAVGGVLRPALLRQLGGSAL
ncbi:ATP phosphoribosyltransferase regulatory subunit [Celeribacter arenosi]|uniref:ATP phosphoribosyltransferase regulatory subunit n=1 Tax=Celeribacter arenosi TaxID=792649 RepID=A0ABP7K4C1_9RHOB